MLIRSCAKAESRQSVDGLRCVKTPEAVLRKAVVFPHLVAGGQPCDMRSVMKRADRNMISDVVDALQARPQRRRWSDDVKAQIVAESYAPGTIVLEVARRHEISPQLLSAWRKAARQGLLKPADGAEPVATRPAETAATQDQSSSSGEASSARGGPGPGHQFVQTGGRPEIDQLGEDVGQIGLRLDAAELAGLNQRSDAGPVLRALIMPGKQ